MSVDEVMNWGDAEEEEVDIGVEHDCDVVVNIDQSTHSSGKDEAPATITNDRVCRFFNTRRGCIKGESCDFSHVRQPCLFFNSDNGCVHGDRCGYLHVKVIATTNDRLKECPNSGCSNSCIGKQCSSCHNAMNGGEDRSRRRDRRDSGSRREHQGGLGRGRGGYGPVRNVRRRSSRTRRRCVDCDIETSGGFRCRECHTRRDEGWTRVNKRH
jgi:hypothetical protein